MIDWTIILHAGIASGTVLLFAALGEILAERSGVMNLGLEGMMLIGAMMAFSTAVSTGQPWLGVLYAMLAAGLLALLHAVVTISFQADQVVSGLAVNFLGIGLSMVLGEGLSKAGRGLAAAHLDHPWPLADPHHRADPVHGPQPAGLPGLSGDARSVVLHQPHAARPAPACGR